MQGTKGPDALALVFLIFCNMALIDWISKRQATIETSVFGAEFVAMKHGIEKLWGLCYKLCMLGIPLTGPSFIYADNKSQAQVTNSTIPELTLKKKCNSICYRVVQESIAMSESLITHIDSEDNYQTLWPKWPAVVNATNWLVTSFMTSMMTILINKARPANPDRLILRGLKKSARSYSTYLRLTFWLKGRSI